MAELSFNRCDIAGLLDEVPAHGVTGVVGSMALDAGQAADLVEHRTDHSVIKSAVTVSVGISILIDFILYFHDNALSSE